MKKALLLLVGAISANAAVLNPISYDMPNGEGNANGGSYNYWDQTYSGSGNTSVDGSPLSGGLGQLTDDILGGARWDYDLGNGNAYEWVGWNNTTPTITFDFGGSVLLDQASIHVDNSQYGGVGMFSSIDMWASFDGVNYAPLSSYVTSNADLSNTANRFIDVPVGENLRYLRLTLHDFPNPTYPWLFISEVDFQGEANQAVPEPSTVFGAVAFASLIVRRLRKK